MKKTLTLCLLIGVGSAQAFAQSGHSNTSSLKERMKTFRALSAATQPSTAKTTATIQRLIANADYYDMGGGLQLADSINYTYDFGRGSEFDFNYLEYSTYISFPNFMNEKYVWFDSMDRSMSGSASSMQYTGNNMPASQTDYSGGNPSNRTTWSYNSNGNITQTLNEYNMGGPWQPTYRSFYIYDANGKMIADSSEVYNSQWDPMNKTEYGYNSNGIINSATMYDYNGGVWDPQYKVTITYTGGMITNSLFEAFNGTTWENAEKMDVTYTGSQKTSEIYSAWNGTSWDLESEEYRSLNGSNLPDSSFYREFYGINWDTTITKLTYNGYSNPVTISYYDGSNTFQAESRYYYQDYDPLSVNNIAVRKTLAVYPNPATTSLNVMASDISSSKINYSILNSIGQAVVRGTEQVNGSKVSLDVQNLAPGNYWLNVKDEKGVNYSAMFHKQ